MLSHNPKLDRYCRFSYNPQSGGHERHWIKYADNTFEPVRRNGSLNNKWNDRRTDFQWWEVRKPADWHPSDDGARFSWNHALGEENKPADWGDKSDHEAEAGPSPFYMGLTLNEDCRIASRTERIDGRRETWEFRYDDAGRLTACVSDTGWMQEFEYDDQGRRLRDYEVGRRPLMRAYRYGKDNRLLSAGDVTCEHDENGFRTARIENGHITRYAYSPDYRLLGADLPGGRAIRFAHDEDGMRRAKAVDGVIVEEYDWLDFIRLAEFRDARHTWKFRYADGERLPYQAVINGNIHNLHYDQSGSLKAVEDSTGNVVKAIQYGPFGDVLWDSNPALHAPIGFAGGLADQDTGFIRFGWRDYDPATGRFTAPDPMGDAGGDADWYGYCLDDPVNRIDPLGLFFGMGMAIAAVAAIAGFGAAAKNSLSDPDDNDTGGNGGKPWANKLRDHAQSLDFREKNEEPENSGGKDPDKEKAEAEADERMSALMQERQEAKERQIAERMSYMDKKMAHLNAKNEEEQETLGGKSEPLGGESEPLGGTEKTVELAKGKPDHSVDYTPSEDSRKAKAKQDGVGIIGQSALDAQRKAKAKRKGTHSPFGELAKPGEAEVSQKGAPTTPGDLNSAKRARSEKSSGGLLGWQKQRALTPEWVDPRSPEAPLDVSAKTNIEKNRVPADLPFNGFLANTLHDIARIGSMVSAFWPGREMDYKSTHGKEYEDFGNFNYGAVGTAKGFSPEALARAAGLVQQTMGAYDPTFGDFWGAPPYGDDPHDQEQIEAGIQYAQEIMKNK